MAKIYRGEKIKIDIENLKDLLFVHGTAGQKILRRAVREALLMHKRLGNSVAVRDGEKVVSLSPDAIMFEDENNFEQKAS